MLTPRLPRMNPARAVSTFLAVALVAGLGGLAASPASAVVTSAPQNVKVAFAGGPSAAEVTWAAPLVAGDAGISSYSIELDGYTDGTSATPVFQTTGTEPVSGKSHEFTNVPPGVFLEAHVKAITTGTGTASDDGASPRIAAYAPTPSPSNATHSKVKPGGVTTIRWKASKKVAGAPVSGYRVSVEGWMRTVKGTSVKIKGFRLGQHRVKIVALSKNGNSKPTFVIVRVNKANATAHQATLKRGSQGSAVKKLRKRLGVSHGKSNYFNKATRRAVIAYQKAHHKKQTGRVNDKMRFALTV